METERTPVEPHEMLFIQTRKRFVSTYGQGETGARELTLHVGLKEFCFDEPDLFPWAEKLMEQDSFTARAATEWTGTPIEWPRIQELLETFVAEGIIARTPPPSLASAPLSAKHHEFLEKDAKRRAFEEPRYWKPDPSAVIREITGRELPASFLECAMPVYMLAHSALDREGRQVGEINTFPDMMRLKLPVDWKACNYAGSRYRREMPMNMTALRSMLANWRPVLRSMHAARAEFLKRFPQQGPTWKLGEVLFGSYSVLATVSYHLMHKDSPVRNGDLDPVLSSLFRVTDGIRMISGHMLDIMERPHYHDEQVDWRFIVEQAEIEDQYRSLRGVCAGPQNMIEELVQTLMNGRPLPPGPDVEPPADWAATIPQGVDFGLLGLQINACLFMVWSKLGLAVASMRDALARVPHLQDGKIEVLRQAMEDDHKRLVQNRQVLPDQRTITEIYYRNIYDQVQPGIRGLAEKDRTKFDDQMFPPASLLGDGARGMLRDLFGSMEAPGERSQIMQEIAGYYLDDLRFERNALKPIAAIQRQINTLLGRPQATEPLRARHIAVGPALRRATFNYGPNSLSETIEKALGVAVDNAEDETVVTYAGRSFALH